MRLLIQNLTRCDDFRNPQPSKLLTDERKQESRRENALLIQPKTDKLNNKPRKVSLKHKNPLIQLTSLMNSSRIASGHK